jgi:hypothetical protein
VTLHHECNLEVPDGCVRCSPKPSRLCCDLHNPTAFAYIASPAVKSAHQPPSSSLAKYKDNEIDQTLRCDLEAWRCKETANVYGKGHLQNLGPGLVMGTTVQDRIVDCAHFSKIQTVADLEKETKWGGASEFGSAITDIIKKHYPVSLLATPTLPFLATPTASLLATPALPPTALVPTATFLPCITPTSMSQNGPSSISKAPRRLPRCSLCHEEGHTSTFMGNSCCQASLMATFSAEYKKMQGTARQGEYSAISTKFLVIVSSSFHPKSIWLYVLSAAFISFHAKSIWLYALSTAFITILTTKSIGALAPAPIGILAAPATCISNMRLTTTL